MSNFAIYPSLKGRVVFVTGGGSGIGAAIVEEFCAQGAKVAFVDIAEAESRALVDSIGAKGHAAPVFKPCDLRDIGALEKTIADVGRDVALEKTIADVGRDVGTITVLVNNAANDQRHAVDDTTVEYWDERMQVNLRHQFFAAKAVYKGMKSAGGGSIINFGSISWHHAQGGMPAYTSAKAAIQGLTAGLARDFGPHKIRVNCVVPGWIMTQRQIDLWLTPEAEAELMKGQCLQEKVYPPDIARMVLWLAADDSRMVTCRNFHVDGGWL